jgi:MFS family permease
MPMKSNNMLVFTACVVGLLSTVGAALPYPVLAPLFAAGPATLLNHFLGLPPKLLLSIAIAINPLGLLLGSALLGPLSDRYGRRPMLLFTTLFSALGHLVSVWALFAQNYPMFLIARFVTGLAEGNTSVARAMLADALEGEERTRGFALLNGALYSGWLIGPLMAGATVGYGNSVPFVVAAAVLGATFVLGAIVFPNQPPSRTEGGFWHHVSERHAFLLLKHKPLRELFVIQIAYTLGVTAFYEFYPLWCVEFAHLGPVGIAVATAVLCAVMTGTSALMGRGVGPAIDERHLRLFGFAVAACIAVNAVGGPIIGMVGLVVFGIPNAFYNAVLPVYCSERFEKHGQGAVMGLISAIFCVSNVLVALIGAGVTLIDTRLIVLLGAAATAWSAWRVAHWVCRLPPRAVESARA